MKFLSSALLSRVKRAARKWKPGISNCWGHALPPKSVQPISRTFGFDRGRPIDRYYIESFLTERAADNRGRVLEVGDDAYTRRFGGEAVTCSEVVNSTPGPGTTVVADLANAEAIPDERYDCLILTQVLPFIFDTRAVIGHCRRILKRGGVLLATQPGISQISRYDMERWGDFWRFTPVSIRRLLTEHFSPQAITIRVYGNVCVASAFLYGLAAEELSAEELDYIDDDYPVTIAVRAVRGA